MQWGEDKLFRPYSATGELSFVTEDLLNISQT